MPLWITYTDGTSHKWKRVWCRNVCANTRHILQEVDPFQRKVDNMLTKTTDNILTKVVLGSVLGVDVVDLILSWE
jgi:hypothetical protein